MKIPMVPTKPLPALAVWLLMAFITPLAQADIYKWTDANGQTHYSSNKADANKSVTTQIKVAPAPPVPTNPSATQDALEHERRFKQVSEKPFTPPSYVDPNRRRSRSGGVEDGSDASRCALARDILDGKFRYGNGKAIDQYGQDTAQNDVRLFCH